MGLPSIAPHPRYGIVTGTSFLVENQGYPGDSSPLMNYQAAIFDIDGTLLDSVDLHAEAWRQTFLRYDKDIPFKDIRQQIGKGGDQLLPVFFSKELLEKHGDTMEKERGKLFKKEFMPRVKPFPDVRPLFERLKRDGLKIALASSATQPEVKHYAELLGIEDLIHAGTSTDDAENSKPHPDIFKAAMKKLGGVSTGMTLTIGDTPYDAEAALKIGIKTVGMLCGGFPEEGLRQAGCIAIYRDPADLLRGYDTSPFVNA